MNRGRRFTATAAAALAFSGGVAVTSCSQDEPAPSALDQLAPTRDEVARAAGIEFPASTAAFRLVRLGPNQIDVTFTLDPADVDEFADGSGVELTHGERTIVHASPLWDVAVTNPVRGGTSTHDGIDRTVEVVDDGDVATVRLSLLQQGEE